MAEVDKVEAPDVDEPVIEEPLDEAPSLEEPPAPQPKVNPLSPGGKRFEQVYAQSKQALRERDKERELRIAAEARLAQLDTKTVPDSKDVEYTWPQLEEFIAQGRITRADAQAHREEVLAKKVSKSVKQEFVQETRTQSRVESLAQSISAYVESIPAIAVEGSADRERLDEEFEWLASVQGLDSTQLEDSQRKALQLSALRNVYGPLSSLEKRTAPAKVEPHQGLPGGTPPGRKANPDQDLLNGLSKEQVAHYKKMFVAGRYPGKWKDVVAELKYVPKSARARA